MYCQLLQPANSYKWADAAFTVEALKVMNAAAQQAPAAEVAVPVAVATAQ